MATRRITSLSVGGLPLIGLEHQLRIQVRATATQAHQPGDAPGHHHVQQQGALKLVDTAQLQRLDAATILERVKEHLDLPGRALWLADLADTPMILTTRGTNLRHIVDAAFAEAGVLPQVQAKASSIQTLLTVVAQGGLATLIPFSALSAHAAMRAVVRRSVEPKILRRASLAWSRMVSHGLARLQ